MYINRFEPKDQFTKITQLTGAKITGEAFSLNYFLNINFSFHGWMLPNKERTITWFELDVQIKSHENILKK